MSTEKNGFIMHKDFFDRCAFAIENQFYMEAILMEYAAIESRLETMLSLLGAPCNKFLDSNLRKGINVSQRIKCLSKERKNSAVFNKTKLPKKFFDDLSKWISKRNEYIHGLFKDEIKYSGRIAKSREFSMQGLEFARLLYNESSRIKRLVKKEPRIIEFTHCQQKCKV